MKPRKWLWVFGLIACAALAIVALWFSSRLLDKQISDPVQFVTGNLLNALIFGAIVAQVLIYRKQRDIMKQQWDSMEQGVKRTDRVIDEMQRQLEATRIAERAYVGIDTIDLVDLEAGKRPHVSVRFLNAGRTPAWHFQAPAILSLGVDPPQDDQLPRRVESEGEGFMPTGAGTTMKYQFMEEAAERTVARITNGERKIFLWGIAYFEDCWNEQRRYVFRLVYSPADGKFQEYTTHQTW